jgi:hypothetical protein
MEGGGGSFTELGTLLLTRNLKMFCSLDGDKHTKTPREILNKQTPEETQLINIEVLTERAVQTRQY